MSFLRASRTRIVEFPGRLAGKAERIVRVEVPSSRIRISASAERSLERNLRIVSEGVLLDELAPHVSSGRITLEQVRRNARFLTLSERGGVSFSGERAIAPAGEIREIKERSKQFDAENSHPLEQANLWMHDEMRSAYGDFLSRNGLEDSHSTYGKFLLSVLHRQKKLAYSIADAQVSLAAPLLKKAGIGTAEFRSRLLRRMADSGVNPFHRLVEVSPAVSRQGLSSPVSPHPNSPVPLVEFIKRHSRDYLLNEDLKRPASLAEEKTEAWRAMERAMGQYKFVKPGSPKEGLLKQFGRFASQGLRRRRVA